MRPVPATKDQPIGKIVLRTQACLISGILCVGMAHLLVSCSAGNYTERLSLGEALYRLVVGGPSISETTLLRFYAWHIMALPLLMLVLIVWHGFRVRRDGGVSSPKCESPDEPVESTPRAIIVRREILVFFLTVAGLIAISVFVEPPIGPKADPGALPEHTKAPWIFLWIQELLRLWPPAIAGVLIPLMVLLLLGLLPFMDWSDEGIALWFNQQGRVIQVVMLVLLLGIFGLTIRAALR